MVIDTIIATLVTASVCVERVERTSSGL